MIMSFEEVKAKAKKLIFENNTDWDKKSTEIYHRAYHGYNSKQYRDNRRIKLKDNPVCEKCHKNKAIGTHHKDYEPGNNDINNLMTVCRKCHNKLHTKIHSGKTKISRYQRVFGYTELELRKMGLILTANISIYLTPKEIVELNRR